MLDVFSALWPPPSVVLGCPPNRGNINLASSNAAQTVLAENYVGLAIE
jgi:hypothetical protein